MSRVPTSDYFLTPKRQPRPGDDPKHLKNVKQCDCVICGPGGNFKVEAHHLLRVDGPKGMGRRNPDRWSLPLCVMCHRALHDNGDEVGFLASVGIDGKALAGALWEAKESLAAMQRVVFEAHEAALRREEG